VQTLDSISALPDGALSSPAARRNAEAILQVLRAHLPARGSVLEIASGSGEHATAFATAMPNLDWTPSDPSEQARDSIAAWTRQLALANLNPPLALDAADPATWPQGPFDALYCANMTHISPWSATEGLMDQAGRVLRRPGGLLALYGPYREANVDLAASNAAFDDSLKARNAGWGLRDRETVEALARAHGLAATLRVQMPANNLILLFRAV
jgi:SAM-dependent methyltransferase